MTTKPFYQPAKRIVITGAPVSGKTAFLEVARRALCPHVEVLTSAPRIVLEGGFPARAGLSKMRPLQRAIFHVQSELESVALANDELSGILCDRGTLDPLAYWPGHRDDFFVETGTTEYEEIQRYEAVLHFRASRSAPREVQDVDARLIEVWAAHPRQVVLDDARAIVANVTQALAFVQGVIDCPACRQ